LTKTTRTTKKLGIEIYQADIDRKMSPLIKYAESLQSLYLQAVVKEAIRRHPEVSYTLERVVPQEREAQCGMMLREALY
ncbi:hypothetical protein BGZ61DRAFT_376333, partial [Ilyonectria robusta]|uniref:uncharacterized protein n=1 Tax=Ilyonectria robusta TaxID=1079257 RepID=UPI001E8EE9A1